MLDFCSQIPVLCSVGDLIIQRRIWGHSVPPVVHVEMDEEWRFRRTGLEWARVVFPNVPARAGKLSTADRATGFVHKDSLSLVGPNFGRRHSLFLPRHGWVGKFV